MDHASRPHRLSFSELFQPKLLTVLSEGYGMSGLRADAMAGLTVAIVALPLSMAIAIASGVDPQVGLFSAIFGGFIVSALGGSRFQIGGPAGAFIVLVSGCVANIGVSGMATACVLAGLMLMAAGALRLGTYVKFIPYPVTVGFTAGIAVIILASQVTDAFGLKLAGAEPGAFWPKIQALWAARATTSGQAVAVSLGTAALIVVLRRVRPRWPAFLIAVTAASVVAMALGMQVETIVSRFGALPNLPPAPHLPPLGLAAIHTALPYAVTFALLGSIESLLSAVVADGMTGRHHRSNAELVAQGLANIVAPMFGGMVVTGTIARTATNVRAGAHGPMAGMLHSVFVLLAMMIFAPLAGHIPLAALAGVLIVVSWNMIEKEEAWALITHAPGDALVFGATFLLVVFRDLTTGILVGFALGSLLFIRRMSVVAQVEAGVPLAEEDRADSSIPYDPAEAGDDEVVIYRLQGAFFFGAASTVGAVLDRIATHPRAFVLDFAGVPFLDTSGARMIAVLAEKLHRGGGKVFLAGADGAKGRTLQAMGLRAPKVTYLATVQDARNAIKAGRG